MALNALAVALLVAAASPGGVAADGPTPLPAVAQDTSRKAEDARAPRADSAETDSASKKKKNRNEPPTPEQMAERKRKAEALPLFRDRTTLPFTLVANFKAISRDRDTLSKREFPGTVIVPGPEGRVDTIPVRLRTRGHYRLARCSFVPLRVDFPKKESQGTAFEGQDAIKLATHCERNSQFEQYVLREYLVYRAHELVSPIGFRARLARATYVDSASGKPLDTRFAFFLESEEDMGARAGGVVQELRGAMFADVDEEALLNLSVFNYMVGGHDWSMYALHNVRLVATLNGRLLPVPYDFDFTGLVDTRYAIPDPRLGIKSVRTRLNRGPCRTPEQLEPTLARFRAAREAVLALYDSLPELDKRYAKNATEYLDEFFRTINRPGDVKAELVEVCARRESS
jgi:hypothetical protein